MNRFITLLYSLLIIYSASAQQLLQRTDSVRMQQWVDSVMTTLSPEQRLGQLIMPQVVGGNTPQVRAEIAMLERKYHIGGILFSKGTIASQNALTQHAQQLAKDSAAYCAQLPLLVGIDGEWGLAMRLTDAPKFPRNKALSNINPNVRDTLCYLYGKEIARECRLLGIHVNFAPVLDVNSNPKNPVIGTRSFGATVESVTAPALAYARGLEKGGVLSTGKHFPGHGDTDVDSHKSLPRLSHSQEVMQQRELQPFASYVEAGLGALMVAHLDVPSLSGAEGVPSTASKEIVTGILRQQMGFEGLIITDGLAMKGASEYPDICTKALLAGNDILLQPYPIERQWKEMQEALRRGDLSQELIDEKCRRVLAWKYALIIDNPVPTYNDDSALENQINSPEALNLLALITKLSQDSTATAPELDPTQQTDKVLTPDSSLTPHHSSLITNHSSLITNPSSSSICDPRLVRVDEIVCEGIDKGAYPGCQILVAQHGKILMDMSYGTMGDSKNTRVNSETRYDLASITKAAATVPAVMLCIDKYGVKLTDKLSQYIPQLKGTDKANLTVQAALFHETGMRSGYNFYEVTLDTIAMEGSKWFSVKYGEPFTVQQDRKTWFHERLQFDKHWISNTKDAQHPLTVAKGMYTRREMRDSILSKIIELPLKNPGKYRYSDLNFVLLRLMVENVSKMSIDQLLATELPELFNEQLGYQPLEHGVKLEEIAPTEDDKALRHQWLRGYVHDELAAWSGGIEGNAGLFGSAHALYPVTQMLLNNGRIGERQAIRPETVKTFTTKKSKVSRRGLGFDKPETDPKKIQVCSDNTDPSVYGHTGFTGSCFWIDPKNEIVFIFICNRVNPHRWNSTLTKENLRSRMQEAIYDALK